MTQGQALQVLQTGVNVFLTGEPGSGKTHTVNEYVAWLRSHDIEPAIAASTGIAATHIHGMTIHSWSGIGIKDFLSPADVDAIASKEHVARRIQKTSVLIIDEVSMLSGNVLSMVDAVCREVRRTPERAFGGMQVVLVGDFFQLPPIGRGAAAAFAFESPSWNALLPVTCYLTEQHRQDDKRFLSVLSSIRMGDWDANTVSTILSRETDEEGLDSDTPRLFTHNADVDRINTDKLGKITAESHTYKMESAGAPTLIEALKRGCLSPEVLTLKEGAAVMGTKNIAASGLVNGTTGIVIGFERGTNYPIIETLDGRELTVGTAEWAVEENGKIRAKVIQIPLRLAWAITVHKSQGMSMDTAAIDLSRAFEYGQGYVALSRVRSLEGLHILGWSEQALQVHPQVAAKDASFRAESEGAEEIFANMEANGERRELMQNFIRSSGGSLEAKAPGEKVMKEKQTTYDVTLLLIEEGKDAEEIAEARGITIGTVADHFEKLVQNGRLDIDAATKALPMLVQASLDQMHLAFKAKGRDKLTPVFTLLKGKYSYDELKLARSVFVAS